MADKQRCGWCLKSGLYRDYHDNEWGNPVYDDTKLFEFLILETMQAGLSWLTILKRREGYRKVFANFDPKVVASYDAAKIDELMQDTSIIRNQKKIEAAVSNAQRFLVIQEQMPFARYIWHFTEDQIIKNHWKSLSEMPTTTYLSDLVSADLKKRGFKFVGSTTVYAYLQAIGVVNDHLVGCFKY